MSFDEIILSQKEELLLSKLKQAPIPEPFQAEDQDALEQLEALNMIFYNHKTALNKPGYEITATGISYMRYIAHRRSLDSETKQRSWAQVLLPVAATIIIALLGFVSCNTQAVTPKNDSISVVGSIGGLD